MMRYNQEVVSALLVFCQGNPPGPNSGLNKQSISWESGRQCCVHNERSGLSHVMSHMNVTRTIKQ